MACDEDIYFFLHASFPHNCSNYFGQDGKWSELQKDGKLIAQKRVTNERGDRLGKSLRFIILSGRALCHSDGGEHPDWPIQKSKPFLFETAVNRPTCNGNNERQSAADETHLIIRRRLVYYSLLTKK